MSTHFNLLRLRWSTDGRAVSCLGTYNAAVIFAKWAEVLATSAWAILEEHLPHGWAAIRVHPRRALTHQGPEDMGQ